MHATTATARNQSKPFGLAAASGALDGALAVDDTDAVVDRVVAGGGTVVEPPQDLGPTRLAVVDDPFGARLTLSHYRPA